MIDVDHKAKLEITSNERDFNDFVVCMDEEERKLIDE
jgi:hypothetical protein